MIQAFTWSEPGGHLQNEDAFDLRPHPQDKDSYLCVLADGQGGRSGGGAAAQLACRVCTETASTHDLTKFLQPGAWSRILQKADRAVCEDPAAGFTTLIALCIANGYLCGASCGDSAVLAIQQDRPGEILTERQYKDPPVGSGAAAFVTFGSPLVRPWVVVVMSDGVWKYAGWQTILINAAEKHGKDLIASIRDRAKLPGNGKLQDDFTLIVLEDRGA